MQLSLHGIATTIHHHRHWISPSGPTVMNIVLLLSHEWMLPPRACHMFHTHANHYHETNDDDDDDNHGDDHARISCSVNILDLTREVTAAERSMVFMEQSIRAIEADRAKYPHIDRVEIAARKDFVSSTRHVRACIMSCARKREIICSIRGLVSHCRGWIFDRNYRQHYHHHHPHHHHRLSPPDRLDTHPHERSINAVWSAIYIRVLSCLYTYISWNGKDDVCEVRAPRRLRSCHRCCFSWHATCIIAHVSLLINVKIANDGRVSLCILHIRSLHTKMCVCVCVCVDVYDNHTWRKNDPSIQHHHFQLQTMKLSLDDEYHTSTLT